jgi:hypothetical protein
MVAVELEVGSYAYKFWIYYLRPCFSKIKRKITNNNVGISPYF